MCAYSRVDLSMHESEDVRRIGELRVQTIVSEKARIQIISLVLIDRHFMMFKPLAAAGVWPHLRCQNGRQRAIEMSC